MKMRLSLAEDDVPAEELATLPSHWVEVSSADEARNRLENLLDFHERTRHLTPSTPVNAES